MWTQWTGDNVKEVEEFCNGLARFIYYKNMKDKRFSGWRLELKTAYGFRPVKTGQFIMKNDNEQSLDLWLRPMYGWK